MRIGDIKIEAIKLMFVNYGHDLVIDDLEKVSKDENYRSYLVNMGGSINRALDRIENACVVPVKIHNLVIEDAEIGKYRDRFDLSGLVDYFALDRVVAENGYYYDGNTAYQLEGDILVIDKFVEARVIYYPKVVKCGEEHDLFEVPLPDQITRLIPLYVKGDLFQEEEPSLAADAKNQFEQLLEDLKQNYVNRQTRKMRVI
jgi:hypothetical protein